MPSSKDTTFTSCNRRSPLPQPLNVHNYHYSPTNTNLHLSIAHHYLSFRTTSRTKRTREEVGFFVILHYGSPHLQPHHLGLRVLLNCVDGGGLPEKKRVWGGVVSNDKKGKYKYRNRKCLNIIEDSDGSSSVVNTEGRIRIARSGPRHQPFSSVERKKERWM
ncbi:hypothetical protein L1887_22589 [Cichorium endivia]|nr:hypothetical protein L1887_22589 [Cichorium endivia]